MSSFAIKATTAIVLILIVAIALQYLASYAVTGAGASFLLRCLGFLVAAATIPLLIWLQRRRDA